jgi:hypothetical protein
MLAMIFFGTHWAYAAFALLVALVAMWPTRGSFDNPYNLAAVETLTKAGLDPQAAARLVAKAYWSDGHKGVDRIVQAGSNTDAVDETIAWRLTNRHRDVSHVVAHEAGDVQFDGQHDTKEEQLAGSRNGRDVLPTAAYEVGDEQCIDQREPEKMQRKAIHEAGNAQLDGTQEVGDAQSNANIVSEVEQHASLAFSSPVGKATMDILIQYSTLLSQSDVGAIRSVSELPCPKPLIKAALLLVLKFPDDAQTREYLKMAYLALANFQQLTAVEEEAVGKWAKIELRPQDATESAQLPAEVSDRHYQRVSESILAELNSLNDDLKALEYGLSGTILERNLLMAQEVVQRGSNRDAVQASAGESAQGRLGD